MCHGFGFCSILFLLYTNIVSSSLIRSLAHFHNGERKTKSLYKLVWEFHNCIKALEKKKPGERRKFNFFSKYNPIAFNFISCSLFLFVHFLFQHQCLVPCRCQFDFLPLHFAASLLLLAFGDEQILNDIFFVSVSKW